MEKATQWQKVLERKFNNGASNIAICICGRYYTKKRHPAGTWMEPKIYKHCYKCRRDEYTVPKTLRGKLKYYMNENAALKRENARLNRLLEGLGGTNEEMWDV